MKDNHSRNDSSGGNSRLNRIDSCLQGYIERDQIAGAVTRVFKDGELIHGSALGWQNRETGTPMQPDSIFRIMSMTKPIGVVAALTLVEEGRLRLDDPVDGWLPELANPRVLKDPLGPLDGETYPAPRSITLRDLLTYRPGYGIGGSDNGTAPFSNESLVMAPGPLSYARRNFGQIETALDLTADEWLARLGQVPLAYAPGERWLYNTSSDILGILVSRAAGESLAEFLEKRIFSPLEMLDTGFTVPSEKLSRFCTGYGKHVITGETVVIDGPNASFYTQPPLFASAAAGLVSTADDYLKFGRMLLDGGKLGNVQILSRKTVDLMTTDQVSEAQNKTSFGSMDEMSHLGFGFGLSVAKRQAQIGPSVGTFNWDGAYGTHWLADPRENLVAVMMIQQMGYHLIPIIDDFNNAVYQALN